ncbi:MAG: PRC-barrel domain-containing protein [Gemmatimonadaceae bacterium]
MADELRRDATDIARPIDRSDDRDMNENLPDPPSQVRIVPLDDVKGEFKVAEDDPDIRGWNVRTSDGQEIGRVNDLIVDTEAMKVRYVEIKLDHELVGGDDDRIVLLPIGEARLDDDEDDVYLSGDWASISALPAYDRTTFNRNYETSLRNRFRGETPSVVTDSSATDSGGDLGAALDELAAGNRVPGADQDFYEGSSYDERRLFGKRRGGRENDFYIRHNEMRVDVDERDVPRDEVELRKNVVRDEELVDADLASQRRNAPDEMNRRPEDRDRA